MKTLTKDEKNALVGFTLTAYDIAGGFLWAGAWGRPSRATRACEKLLARGLVEDAEPRDGGFRTYKLTPAGTALRDKLKSEG